ncbi:hypothetical protein [Streptomyces chrestomyceticus]|uniref:hypothetical protein n=1 Tax=Streptomyces chrestomyceticus TaxID=68185 RepID=UPI0037A24AF0
MTLSHSPWPPGPRATKNETRRVHAIDPPPRSTQDCPYAYAATALSDDLADQNRGLLQAVAVLADELFQAYGYAETG